MSTETEQRSVTAQKRCKTPTEPLGRMEFTTSIREGNDGLACIDVFLRALAKYSVSRTIAASLHRSEDGDRN